MNAEHEALKKRLGIPEGGKVNFIDMDKNRIVPVVTAGWTDDQIKAKSEQDLADMIAQRTLGLAQLEQTVDNERGEIAKLNQVLARKRQLGD